MIRAVITVRPVGEPGMRFTGLFPSTTDAALFALDRLGERAGKLSVKVQK